MITPIVFMAATSFKTGQEVYELSIIPDKPTLAELCVHPAGIEVHALDAEFAVGGNI
jgi:ABC-type glycerol-3-phosphate transport system permease component